MWLGVGCALHRGSSVCLFRAAMHVHIIMYMYVCLCLSVPLLTGTCRTAARSWCRSRPTSACRRRSRQQTSACKRSCGGVSRRHFSAENDNRINGISLTFTRRPEFRHGIDCCRLLCTNEIVMRFLGRCLALCAMSHWCWRHAYTAVC